jgi:hypothetical protein
VHFQHWRIRDRLQRGSLLGWERRRERDSTKGRDQNCHHDVGRSHDVLLLAMTERDRGSMSGLSYGDDFTAQLDTSTKLGRDAPWQEIITPIDFVLEGRIMVWPRSLVQA